MAVQGRTDTLANGSDRPGAAVCLDTRRMESTLKSDHRQP